MTKPTSSQLTRESFPTSLVDSLLDSLPSPHTRRSYAKGIAHMLAFAGSKPITEQLIARWRTSLAKTMAPPSVNTRIAAVRALVRQAQEKKLISAEQVAELGRMKGMPNRGDRVGNWLEPDQVKQLLTVPDRKTLKGKRDHCIIALLVGCALRRTELVNLDIEVIQQREGRWVLADLPGKGGRVRTVAIPGWVKQSIDAWMKAAKIANGRLIRRMRFEDAALSADAIWEIVRDAALQIGVPNFGPHDLRRTCAKLCRKKGGGIEQIQMLLGHASILTTERYLGTTQNLKNAVNDDIL